MTQRAGFTLAEVLITLGIIGVVAALTMPALMASYQKKVLETRIKKFYSVQNQVISMKIAQDGAVDTSMAGDAEKFFNANYAPYMKVIKTEKVGNHFAVAFPDGSGMVIGGGGDNNNNGIWCVDYKNCLERASLSENIWNTPDGKNVFLFKPVNGNFEQRNGWDGTREQLKEHCRTWVAYCMTLIWYDGWEIKDDYPWF